MVEYKAMGIIVYIGRYEFDVWGRIPIYASYSYGKVNLRLASDTA